VAFGKEGSVRNETSLSGRVRRLALREGLFSPGARILVMVSGGQDSLALLHLLATGTVALPSGCSLHALHVNHHLRGAESLADQALVEKFCHELGIELIVVDRSVKKSLGNVQEVARLGRREAALDVATQTGSSRIALGHTADDQVETMLYRLGRYGGLAAFRAMLPLDPPWVRPLMDCRRADTERYCREHGLVFARDRGNEYPGYARTHLRSRVLPELESALPGAVEAAGRAAEVAAELEAAVQHVVDERYPGAADRPDLSASRLLGLPGPLRRVLLHDWVERRTGKGGSRASILAVESMLPASGSGDRSLAGGWLIRKEYDRLSVERHTEAGGPAAGVLGLGTMSGESEIELPVPGEVTWGRFRLAAERPERLRAFDPRREAYLDMRRVSDIPLLLRVRGIRPGDRMTPLGSAGSRKLQDILVDRRVPARLRPRIPVVEAAGTILWLCGLVVSEAGRIGPDTESLLHLSIGAVDDDPPSNPEEGVRT